MTRRWPIAVLFVATACGASGDDGSSTTTSLTGSASAPDPTAAPPSSAPPAPEGDAPAATEAFDQLVAEIVAGSFDTADIVRFADAADARHAWLLSDLLRLLTDEVMIDTTVEQFDRLTGTDLAAEGVTFRTAWNTTTNRLIAWDTPAPPDYRRLKGSLFTLLEPRWAPFFDDAASTIDYRWLSWGGVFVDTRPLGTPEPCSTPGCIPALDDPTLVAADEGDWYDDDRIVFGVTEGDEAVAFPKNIMEIHEMVNITIGGRRFGIPYCTLCGSAQAFYTDGVPADVDTPVLRTSGLLSRSNKVMFDLLTFSVFDTFTGEAVSGPLRELGVELEQNTVAVSTWGEWKTAHPDTLIVAEDGGIGRTYADDPLGGRDDDGPIFPIGDADGRLSVQDAVIGVVLDDGSTVAFSAAALDEIADESDGGAEVVEFAGISVVRDGGGYRTLVGGDDVASHQAFWFAWSQFHPDTQLWAGDG
jgi:hypothetical protein